MVGIPYHSLQSGLLLLAPTSFPLTPFILRFLSVAVEWIVEIDRVVFFAYIFVICNSFFFSLVFVLILFFFNKKEKRKTHASQ
jgi:hypothetical protein